jgi:hypothetical protein
VSRHTFSMYGVKSKASGVAKISIDSVMPNWTQLQSKLYSTSAPGRALETGNHKLHLVRQPRTGNSNDSPMHDKRGLESNL